MSAAELAYPGSRSLKQRYTYSPNSRAGFAELSPGCVMSGRELFSALGKVDGARSVARQTPKYAQGNPSPRHFMQQNVLVRSELGVLSRKLSLISVAANI